MGTPEFPDLGQHCSATNCNLVDFLPFTCDACHQVFCLEHRSYGTHQCPKANIQDVTVLVCPLCAKSVRLVHKEDPNITWDRHVQSNCDPSNYAKTVKKPKCPVPGCKEALTFSNKVTCKDCSREICLKHRFGADHNCQTLRKVEVNRSPSFSNKFLKSFRERTSLGLTGGGKSNSGEKEKAVSTVDKTMTKLGATTNGLLNTVKGSVHRRHTNVAGQSSARLPSSSGNSLKELCPQCGQQFSTVGELIQHTESVHMKDRGRSNAQVPLDICPKCGRGFKDPIALVHHVERDHGGSSNDKCVIS